MSVIKAAGLICCSNPILNKDKSKAERIIQALNLIGIECFPGKYLFADSLLSAASPYERAQQLNQLWKDNRIDALFDLSGGDLANQILNDIDYAAIAWSNKELWGYSDLTCVLNAIYAKTGKTGVLYTVQNLIKKHSIEQTRLMWDYSHGENSALFELSPVFRQGQSMEGIMVGGNIRCLLKLAGTEYFPDMDRKILLLEARSGDAARVMAYFAQLKQLNVFNSVSGILLGNFSELEQDGSLSAFDLIRPCLSPTLPVAVTDYIGHGDTAKAARIGAYYCFKE